MERYGLQRGVRGSEARQTTTAQYYRDFLYFASKGSPLESGSRSSSTSFTTIRKKALYSFKTEKESNIRINLLSLNRKGIVKNWLGYLLSVSLSVIKMKDYEKVSVHIVFIGRYQ